MDANAYDLPSDLWEPQRRGILGVIEQWRSGLRPILYSPTGGGKTRQAIELLKWADCQGLSGVFYVNRRLLIHQTSRAFDAAGLPHGVRAAECEDQYDPDKPFQIASADTEASRVIEKGWWQLHDANVVIVDEAHLQRSKAMDWILRQYKERGAQIVLLTATPVEMGNWADSIVISGKLQEYRDTKALVPAICKGISQCDTRKVKRNKTGEFVLDGKKKAIFTQSIVGDVIRYWKEFNPDARATMVTWPGVAESVWGTEQFCKQGVRWAHVDATYAVLDGEKYKLTPQLWQDLIGGYRDGSISGISNRFKAREGIDLPNTYHMILATPIGSLASYLQTVGRAIRYSAETPDHVIVTDHGGAYHSHGSPNHDRPWDVLWNMSEHAASTYHQAQIKEGKKPESIVCFQCKTERAVGDTCPTCGYKSSKSKRRVVMESGEIVEHEGKLIRKQHREKRNQSEEQWRRLYFAWKKNHPTKTFRAMEGWFIQKHGYRPTRDLPLMPMREIDWFARLRDVPSHQLSGGSQ